MQVCECIAQGCALADDGLVGVAVANGEAYGFHRLKGDFIVVVVPSASIVGDAGDLGFLAAADLIDFAARPVAAAESIAFKVFTAYAGCFFDGFDIHQLALGAIGGFDPIASADVGVLGVTECYL